MSAEELWEEAMENLKKAIAYGERGVFLLKLAKARADIHNNRKE